jgi:integrase
MSVKKRADSGSWQVSFTHQSLRIRKSFDTEADALQWEANAKAAIAAGKPLNTDEPAVVVLTLSALAKACEMRYWRGTKNEDNALRHAEEMVQHFGKDKLAKSLTTSDIDGWVQQLTDRGNSAATVNRKLAVLSKVLRFALSRGHIDRVPVIERRKESKGKLRWYTIDEETRLLKAAYQGSGGRAFTNLLTFLADTGARLGEAMALTWGDVSDIYVRFPDTKSGEPRSVPMTSRVRAMLSTKGQPGETVFPQWSHSWLTAMWKSTKDRAGIKDDAAVLHTWRHTCASRLVQAGTPIQVVQQWLGHKTLTMTLRYAHLAPANIVSAVAALERAQQEPPADNREVVGKVGVG